MYSHFIHNFYAFVEVTFCSTCISITTKCYLVTRSLLLVLPCNFEVRMFLVAVTRSVSFMSLFYNYSILVLADFQFSHSPSSHTYM